MHSCYVNGFFSFPPNFDFNIIPGRDSNVTVITIIGESDLFTCVSKMEYYEKMLGKSVVNLESLPEVGIESSTDLGNNLLNGVYCEELRTVFIHLRSFSDAALLSQKVKTLVNNTKEEDIFDIQDSLYVKILLYLLLISDFIVINIVGLNFDTTYVQIFTQANILRKRLKHITENELKTISSSIEVTNHGRLVQPRLLFVFHPSYSKTIKDIESNDELLLELRDHLEEKLFAYLKHHNVIGYEFSIARIEVNRPFVYIQTPQFFPIRSMADRYYHHFRYVINNPEYIDDQKIVNALGTFEKFIQEQIDALHIVKDRSASLCDHINVRSWFKACHKLYNLFCSDKVRYTEVLAEHKMQFFKKYSEMSLSIAENHYKEGLPTQYSRDIHSEKTKSARRVILSLSRGPSLIPMMKQLEENLSKVWAIGRQICEAISLIGLRCKHEVHRLPTSDNEFNNIDDKIMDFYNNSQSEKPCSFDSNINQEDKSSTNQNLPVMRHSSEIQLVAGCNCGRRQATRRDPFDYQEANIYFYEQMVNICCFKFSRANLPENLRSFYVQKSNYTTKRNRKNSLEDDDKLSEEKSVEADEDDEFDDDNFNDDEEDEFDQEHNAENDESNDDDNETDDVEDLCKKTQRRLKLSTSSNEDKALMYESYSSHDEQVQTPQDTIIVEKKLFHGMFCSLDETYSAPYFSSWSLMDCGPYFSYTHSTGLEYPGFVHGSNFLLPWDIPLKTKINKVRKQRVKRAFAAGNFLKAFIGFEMECPIGHRFFLAGPDRMMRGSMASHQVKEAVNGLLTQDVPLYMRCQCSSYMGQLMRIYIAVPPNSGLMKLCIRPRVRPGPPRETPIFSPGSHKNAIELEAGRLWVLRLPFAYYNHRDKGTLYRSSDEITASESRLLKESVFYEEHISKSDYHNQF